MELEWLLLPFTELELSGDTTLWLPPLLFLKPLRRKLNDKEGDLIIPLDALLGMGISLEGETTDGWNDLGEDGGRSISSVTITIAIGLLFFSGRDQFVACGKLDAVLLTLHQMNLLMHLSIGFRLH